MEYAHHRDPLVPRQQRFGQYTRSLMKGLGVPVHNQYGLRPATVQGTRQLATARQARRPRYSRLARRRADLQLPSASAALRDHDDRCVGHSPAGAAADRPVASRIRSRKPVTVNSTCSCGCRRRAIGPATSCWPIRRSSRRCSAATTASSGSGKTSRRSDAATESGCRTAGRLHARGCRQVRTRRVAACIRSA